MLPFFTSAGVLLPSAPVSSLASSLVMAGFSRSTSAIRRAQAMDRVIIMKIMETIMRDIMIWVM